MSIHWYLASDIRLMIEHLLQEFCISRVSTTSNVPSIFLLLHLLLDVSESNIQPIKVWQGGQ